MARIAILGAGMMGTAFAFPAADNGHEVRLVGTPLDGAIVERLLRDRVHPKLGVRVPDGVVPFPVSRLEEAARGADVVALGVSSAGIPWASAVLERVLEDGVPLAMITKGLRFEGGRFRCFPDVIADALPAPLRARTSPVGVAGPCIAGELARRVETSVVFAGRDRAALDQVAALFSGPYYHVHACMDVLGVEICAALKNALAMGIGFAAGLHERQGGAPGSVAMHNHESASFAEALREMAAVLAFAGCDPAHAMGLPGAGDLHVTCNGGRTGRFGKHLGTGVGLAKAIEAMEGATLECLEILAVLREAQPALREARCDLPMLEHLAEVALDGAPVAMPFARFFGRAP